LAGAVLVAGLLLAGLAPLAAAEARQSPQGWIGTLGQSIASWWASLSGVDGGPRAVFAASELAPSLDPDGQELAPSLDPNGAELAPRLDPNGNELAPSLDPDG
jgi:hypothetical protein